jgi:membrane protease YdiL (CAAX protease family)
MRTILSFGTPHGLQPAGGVARAAAAGPLVAWCVGVLALAALALTGRMPAVAVLLVVSPLLEELVFRAGVQEALLRQRVPGPAANVLATLAFAALHGVTRSWPLAAAVLLPSLVLGALYQRTRRPMPVVLAHAAMNLCWLAFATAAPGLSHHFL